MAAFWSMSMNESEPDIMTKAQRDAVCKAYELLGEHFDQSVIVINFITSDEKGKMAEAHEGFWTGGSMAAMGLCEFAKDRILHSGRSYVAPEET